MARKHTPSTGLSARSYIVGIGASAGGLEAIHELFDNMPPDTNMAFVIIQHLSPDYKSLLAELVSKHTEMNVFEAEDDMALQRNCVYVIPTKKIMTVKNGKLRLHDKNKSALPNTAIDTFFESLAEDKKECAVGIVLSGTGTDGSRGIESIKEQRGIVVVQDPITAKFDGMPNSAIATGFADLILPPEMIAEELIEYVNEGPLAKSFHDLSQKDENIVRDILSLIKEITTHDFSHYKRPTINRRLAKRMAEKGIKSLQEYHARLSEDSDEVKKLSKDFLIGVTKFFRDEEAFDRVRELVLPHVFSNKKDDESVKIWVVACSTGEEAYSLAILVQEYLEKSDKPDTNVKIFATDIDQSALEIATKGIYQNVIEKDVSRERLEKYFVHEGNAYRVSPNLRRMVVFAQHDVLKDPPFSKLDFISCRNMLIYMSSVLQNNVHKTFHFALNTGGFLMLGPSENPGILKDAVTELDKKWRIYKCVEKARSLEHEPFLSPLARKTLQPGSLQKSKNAVAHLSDIFRDTLLEEYRMAGIFIDREFEVKHAIGRFKDFMDFPEDHFNFNLLKLVPTELSVAISMCVRKAIKTNDKAVIKHVRIRQGKNERTVTVIVKPHLQQKQYLQPFLFVVVMEEEMSTVKLTGSKKSALPKIPADHKRVLELEDELKETRENLQAAVEELETSNEELQSSNEEMISSNEELQSTNEELQSLNEELHTVNAEHQLKIKELIELNDDLNNYFRNSNIGQIFLDENLIIRKFSPEITKQVNLIESDIGRSITDISTNLTGFDFIGEVKSVMHSGKPVEHEVTVKRGMIYLMKICPYVRQDKSREGVVVNFIDITETKRLTGILTGVFNASPSGIKAFRAVRDSDGKLVDLEWVAANQTVQQITGERTNELLGKRFLKDKATTVRELFPRYAEVVETGVTKQFDYQNPDTKLWYSIVAAKMDDGLVVTLTDVTDTKRVAELLVQNYEALKNTTGQLEHSNKQLEQSNYDLMQFASVASHDLKEPLRKIQAFGHLLKSKAGDRLDGETQYLDKMIGASSRMQHLIDDVLTLSKLSNKDIPFVRTNLNDTLKHMLDDLEITINERNAKIVIAELPTIDAVPGQMNQLFQNLIGNALKFNEHKTPTLNVKTHVITAKEAKELGIDAKAFTCISVQDNGIGFEEAYSEKIFGLFQRLHGSAEYKGTGIGLAICKKIVENHNGFIRARSAPGKGSTFFIYLPLVQEKSREVV